MNKKMIFMVMLVSLIAVWSCDSAKEKVEEATDKAGEMVNDAADKTTELADEVAKKAGEAADKVENIVENNFMIGTWSGKFDIRTGIIEITKQSGNNFEGKVTINLRTVIKQEIKGEYDPKTNKIVMKDQLRSKFKGVYNGTLSEDKQTMSGTFTKNLDNKKYQFNFNKK
jgi:hypothetical protein